jgi:MFS family permease
MKIHRNIILLGVLSLCSDIASQMVYPLLPKFLLNLGATALLIGIIEGIAEATASFFKPLSGRFSDRADRRKPFVFWGYFISAFAKPLFALANAWGWVLGIRFLDRVGKALRNPPRDAILTESVTAQNRGYAFGVHRAFDRVGSILGPLIALAILYYYPENFLLVFLFAGIPGLIGLFFLRGIVEKKEGSAPEKKQEKFTANPYFRWFLVAAFIFTLGNSSNAFLILKADEVGLATVYLPLIWALYNLVSAISSPFLGRLSDRIGRRPVISISFIFYTIIYFGFAQVADLRWLWLLFGLYGIHYGLSKGIFKAYIADLAPPDQKGAAFGVFEMWMGIGLVLASVLMGWLWDTIGSVWAFRISASFSLLGWLIFVGSRYFDRSVVRSSNELRA